MFGNISVQIPIYLGEGPSPPDPPESKTVFGSGAKLQSEMNTSVSAVAILRVFNPTLWHVHRATEERLQKELARDFDAVWRASTEAEEQAIEAGVFDPEARLARLILLHNPHAAFKLDLDRFGGPHDDQWALAGEEYTAVAKGRMHWEVPT